MTRAETLGTTLAPGPGVMANRAALEDEALGRFPTQAMARPPVWAIRRTGRTCRVQPLHADATGILRAATGSFGRVVPAGRP